MLDMLARNWWALVLRGLCGIAFGVMAFAWPGVTLEVLVLMYGIYALADGIFATAAIVSGRAPASSWWAILLEGITGIGAGIATFAWPGITLMVLIYLIAGWAIATGVFEIIAAVRLRQHIQSEWFLILAGIVSILFGFLVAARPVAAAEALAWMVGAYAILFGVLFVVLGLRLRGMGQRLPAMPAV